MVDLIPKIYQEFHQLTRLVSTTSLFPRPKTKSQSLKKSKNLPIGETLPKLDSNSFPLTFRLCPWLALIKRMPSSSNNPKRCLLSCSTAYTNNSTQKKLTNYNVQICLCQEFEHKNMKTIQSLQQNRHRQKENKKNENTVFSCNL